jgi:hypothetical protein
MKTIALTFVERVKLAGLLGALRGLSLSETADFGKLFNQVRFSDGEMATLKVDASVPQAVTFSTEHPDDFLKDVTVECPALLRSRLENHHDYAVGDEVWVNAILERLSAPEPKKKERKR